MLTRFRNWYFSRDPERGRDGFFADKFDEYPAHYTRWISVERGKRYVTHCNRWRIWDSKMTAVDWISVAWCAVVHGRRNYFYRSESCGKDICEQRACAKCKTRWEFHVPYEAKEKVTLC